MPWQDGDYLTPANLNTKFGTVFPVSAYTDLQSAISGAFAVGGGVVSINTGSVITVNTAVRVLSGVALQGVGSTSSIVAGSALADSVLSVPDGTRFWAIRNLSISASATSASVTGIDVGAAQDWLIDSVSVSTCTGNGIRAVGAQNFSIQNCTIANLGSDTNASNGIIASQCTRFAIVNNRFSNIYKQGIMLYQQVRDFVVRGNIVQSAENGIRLNHLNGASSVQSIEHGVIANNVVSLCSVDGIRLQGQQLAVTGNSVSSNANGGIRTGGSGVLDPGSFRSSLIGNNSVYSNGANGIHVTERDMNGLSIVGNQCSGNSGSGVAFGSTSSSAGTILAATVNDNQCLQNRLSGILMDNQTFAYCNVSGNVCANNGAGSAAGNQSGINTATVILSNIVGNTCYDNQSVKSQNYGIRLTTSSDSNVIVGNMARAADHAVSSITYQGANNEVGHNII
jgi:parallel beta helix pectate lyase-like protein